MVIAVILPTLVSMNEKQRILVNFAVPFSVHTYAVLVSYQCDQEQRNKTLNLLFEKHSFNGPCYCDITRRVLSIKYIDSSIQK